MNQTVVNNVADSSTPSGDSPQILSPTKNSQDIVVSNGALTSLEPYPCEVYCSLFLLFFENDLVNV